jgi:hypothetical protein
MVGIKQNILFTIDDLVGSFMYYDRKEDPELPVDAIEEAIKDGTISVDEIIDEFASELRRGLL